MTSSLADAARERLTRALGPQAATRHAQEALSRIGIREIQTPDELLRFAEQLFKMGADNFVLQSVSRSLKVMAILHGAKQ